MQILVPVIVGVVLGFILSYLYVEYIHGHERRAAIIALGTGFGGIAGGVIAWWLTS